MWRAVSRNVDIAVMAAAVCFGLGLFLVWAANGFTWSSSPRPVVAKKRPVVHVQTPPAPRPARKPRPLRRPTLTLVAAGGPAWVSIGSPTGRTLYEGLLSPRQKLTLTGPSYIARFQASGNLEAWIAGRRADLRPFELRRVAITRAGIRLLASSPERAPAPAVVAS